MIPIASWQAQPKLLGMSKQPVYPIPAGKVIFFTEMCDAVSTRNSRLSQNVNSASVMTFAVNQEVFEDPILLEIFTKTILGGWCETTGQKEVPYAHPYLQGVAIPNVATGRSLYAKDIVELVPMEFVETPSIQAWAKYNFVKVTINFETLEYPVEKTYSRSEQGAYNPNFVRVVVQTASNRISTPIGWYEFKEGFFGSGNILNLGFGYPATYGSWFTMPYSNIEMTVFHCTRQHIYLGGNLNIVPFWAVDAFFLDGNPGVGKVNSVTFANCPPEKLLFDSAQVQPWTDWLGEQMFNVKLNFIYNSWGWNNSIDPGGQINRIGFVKAPGGPPFQKFDFSSLFMNILNPMI